MGRSPNSNSAPCKLWPLDDLGGSLQGSSETRSALVVVAGFGMVVIGPQLGYFGGSDPQPASGVCGVEDL